MSYRKSLSTDFLLTAIAQVAVMVGTFLIYGLLSRLFSAKGVGEYALIRRGLYFIQPVALLGITVAVPRFLPMRHDKAERAQIAAVGFIIVLISAVLIAGMTLYERERLAVFIFGDSHAQVLVASFAAMTIAFSLHSYVFSYFRGMLQMRAANMLDIMNSGILPLLAVLICAPFNVAMSFFVLAVSTVLCTIILARPLWREILMATKISHSVTLTKSILKYGLPRIPGDFALAGMLLGAPWLVAQHSDLSEAGRFAIAQTLLMVPGAGFAALGVVLLPYVSKSLAINDFESVKSDSIRLFQGIIENSIYFCLHVYIMADVIVRFWVGQSMIGAAGYIRIMMIAVPFYVTYFVFRSVIDAFTEKPVTTVNLIIAFIVFAICYILLVRLNLAVASAAALSLTAGYITLGMLTFMGLTHFLGAKGFVDTKMVKNLFINIAIAMIVFIVRFLFEINDIFSIALEILALFVYLAAAIKMRREWALSILRSAGVAV